MPKTFKDSPAMAFFTPPPGGDPEPEEQPANPAQAPQQAHAQVHAQAQKEMRTKRLPLMLTPSMYQRMCLRAGAEDISLNELAIRAINRYLQNEQER